MKLLAFELSMPARASWDGRWSGDGEAFVRVRRVPNDAVALEGRHSYAWSDGWCAAVEVRVVDGRTAEKLRRRSSGFCGYDWMIDSLLACGRIDPREPREASQ